MTNTGIFNRGNLVCVAYRILVNQRTGNHGYNSEPRSGMLVKVLCRTSPANDTRSASSLTTPPPNRAEEFNPGTGKRRGFACGGD